jgi:hypothetical protein
MYKDKQLTHMAIVSTVLLFHSMSVHAFLQGFMGKGPFLMEEGLGTMSPCHLDDMMREEHIDAELMTITVLFYLGRLFLKTW